jgi:murein L,D-transpeptidase YcbB/YkuD
MRKLILPFTVILFLFATISCKKNEVTKSSDEFSFDSTLVKTFFTKYPKLKKHQADVEKLYRKHQYHYVWYDKNGVNEFGNALYNKINNLDEEGIQAVVPYKEKLDQFYEDYDDDQKPNMETELLLSSLYFFYANQVFHGIDIKKSNKLGWFLPREKQAYGNYLDSLLIRSSLINKDKKGVISQYFLLKDVLENYREIEKKGGWKKITIDPNVKAYKPGDKAETIAQIRERLFINGDITSDSKSSTYDQELATGILRYKKRNGILINTAILPEHINEMNVPVAERIKTIIVNMERCRWISDNINKAEELIFVNIPAYQMTYFKKGKPALISNVVVGKVLNKTVIFSAPMRYIAFSPYWNVPTNILKKEVLPEIEKNPNYLAEHNMEWDNGNVRQKPGPDNSLGKVKFLFPNSNAIYLHDTPAKSLFGNEDRSLSHGCVRVAKAKELANLILKDDKNWTPEKIEEAMNSNEEFKYTLKEKIPVYIGYFTAWVDHSGSIRFYDDIYKRDEHLASLLFIK